MATFALDETNEPIIEEGGTPGLNFILEESDSAVTYYISTTGSDGNVGSEASPWATFNKANTTVVVGDTVLVRGGAYSGANKSYFSFTKDGVSEGRITYRNYPSETPIIDGADVADPGGDNNFQFAYRIMKIGGDYTTFDGFEIKNSIGQGPTIENAVGVRITNCHVHNCYLQGIVAYVGANNAEIDNNTVHDFRDTHSSSGDGTNADGIQVSGATVGDVQGVIVHHNTVYNASDDGIDLFRSTNCTVHSNICRNNGIAQGDGNGFKLGGTNLGGSHTAYNNLAYDNRANGFDTNGASGVLLYNNTAWSNDGYGVTLYGGISTARNNLSWQNGTNHGLFDTQVTSHNSWDLGTGDPLFVNTGTFNFRLTASSPAINVGTDLLSVVTTDFDGVARPATGLFDLGAFEFVAAVVGHTTNVSLTWVANIDSDLLKYRVYYGPAPGVSTASIDVGAPALGAAPSTSTVINGLPNGRQQYFWVTAIDAALNESAISNVVSVINKIVKIG